MQTILLIDDDDAIVDNLKELFQDGGFRVVTAANGKEGVERALTERPDLILTDFVMPIADGRAVVLALKSMPEFRSTPIVMMSGSLRGLALADGNGGTLDVSAFLAKPVSWETVLALAIRLLGGG